MTWSSMLLSSISVYVCVHVLKKLCAFISFMAPASTKPSPVSTPCIGSSKAMSAAKDQRCRGSLVTTCIFVNFQGCRLPVTLQTRFWWVAACQNFRFAACQNFRVAASNELITQQNTRQGSYCSPCRPGLW